jgi:hypothetical protein
MKRDKRYKRLKEAFDTLPIYQLKIGALNDELANLHKIREIRRLNVADPAFVDALIKANLQEMSTRGRASEIMMECVRVVSKLGRAVKSLQEHFLITYQSDLRSFRTKEERLQIVGMVLRPFEKYISDAEALKEVAQLIVTDIDKDNFTMDKILRALEMHVAKERKI